MTTIIEEKKYNIVYKITNLLNNRFYIGAHSTNKLNDSYLGSGTAIKEAIKKYGKNNFKKEILFYLNSSQEMYAQERKVVVLCAESYNLTSGGGFPLLFTPEMKQKISIASSQHQKGVGNSQYKSFWVTDGITERKIEPNGNIPEGFYRGRNFSYGTYVHPTGEDSPTTGKRWATNGQHTIYLKKGESVPEGYIVNKKMQKKNRDKTNNSKLTNMSNYANRKVEQRWINNKLSQTLILLGEDLPEGYEWGKIKGTFIITNGIIRIRQNPHLPIPAGFARIIPKKSIKKTITSII